MTDELVLLTGRKTRGSREVARTHAERLRHRDVADAVMVADYEREPARELGDELSSVDADTVYAAPLAAAQTRDTVEAIPRALSHLDADVRYCPPPGEDGHATRAVVDRAKEAAEVDRDTSLVLIGYGDTEDVGHRETVERQAGRLRDLDVAGEVVTCYLIQDPSVECVRYNVSRERTVAVPFFISPSHTTEDVVPDRLDVDRGGVTYAEPIGDHEAVTDALERSILEKREAVREGRTTWHTELVSNAKAVATDGEG